MAMMDEVTRARVDKQRRTGDRLLDIPCKVCGDRSSGKHYGIFSCDGTNHAQQYREPIGPYLVSSSVTQGVPVSSRDPSTGTEFTPARRKANWRTAVQLIRPIATNAGPADCTNVSSPIWIKMVSHIFKSLMYRSTYWKWGTLRDARIYAYVFLRWQKQIYLGY